MKHIRSKLLLIFIPFIITVLLTFSTFNKMEDDESLSIGKNTNEDIVNSINEIQPKITNS